MVAFCTELKAVTYFFTQQNLMHSIFTVSIIAKHSVLYAFNETLQDLSIKNCLPLRHVVLLMHQLLFLWSMNRTVVYMVIMERFSLKYHSRNTLYSLILMHYTQHYKERIHMKSTS